MINFSGQVVSTLDVGRLLVELLGALDLGEGLAHLVLQILDLHAIRILLGSVGGQHIEQVVILDDDVLDNLLEALVLHVAIAVDGLDGALEGQVGVGDSLEECLIHSGVVLGDLLVVAFLLLSVEVVEGILDAGDLVHDGVVVLDRLALLVGVADGESHGVDVVLQLVELLEPLVLDARLVGGVDAGVYLVPEILSLLLSRLLALIGLTVVGSILQHLVDALLKLVEAVHQVGLLLNGVVGQFVDVFLDEVEDGLLSLQLILIELSGIAILVSLKDAGDSIVLSVECLAHSVLVLLLHLLVAVEQVSDSVEVSLEGLSVVDSLLNLV